MALASVPRTEKWWGVGGADVVDVARGLVAHAVGAGLDELDEDAAGALRVDEVDA